MAFIEGDVFRGSRAMPVEDFAVAILSEEARRLAVPPGVSVMVLASVRVKLRHRFKKDLCLNGMVWV